MESFVLSAFADEIADSLITQMDVLESHGINHIEMRNVNGRPLVDHKLDEVRVIKKVLDGRGFKISAIGSPLGKFPIDGDFVQQLALLKHCLDIAAILQTRYIRMFSFFMPKGVDPAEHRPEVIRRWQQFLQMAKGHDIILLHENHDGVYGDTPERCLDLLDSLPSPQFQGIFDPANFIVIDREPYPQAYQLLKQRIVYFHIKDALNGSHQIKAAGQGHARIQDMLQTAKDSGFHGFLSLEPHLIDNQPGAGPELFGTACNALKKILADLN